MAKNTPVLPHLHLGLERRPRDLEAVAVLNRFRGRRGYERAYGVVFRSGGTVVTPSNELLSFLLRPEKPSN